MPISISVIAAGRATGREVTGVKLTGVPVVERALLRSVAVLLSRIVSVGAIVLSIGDPIFIAVQEIIAEISKPIPILILLIWVALLRTVVTEIKISIPIGVLSRLRLNSPILLRHHTKIFPCRLCCCAEILKGLLFARLCPADTAYQEHQQSEQE